MDADKPKQKKLYQVWRGSNRFFFGGRLVFGPDFKSLFLSAFLIAGPAITFCIKIMYIIKQNKDVTSWYPLLIVAILLTILDMFLLLVTASRDPGIVPRNSKPPEFDELFEMSTPSMEWSDGTTPHLKLPPTRDVLVDGHTVKVKFCNTCLLYRPPRASHCYICNNCVQRFDHHCPWIGQCVGIRNYRFFYMFVSTSTILCAYVFVVSWIDIVQTKRRWLKALSKDVLSAVLIVYCFIVFWFIGGLTVFHLYLMSTNQTTHENFRCRGRDEENPYDKGIIKNIKEILLSEIPPSLNDFRALVQEDQVTVTESSAPSNFSQNITSSKANSDFEKGDERSDSGLIFFSVEQEMAESVGSSATSEVEVIAQHAAG
ncbi:probable protein S-acyltransferase 4 [Henckelia pumila]|uniref:probable protein S-acyltransferase 4 n=1 Tax=Henckelia pumila TaxID=405737 RepID=UPI003C6E4133